MKKAVIAGLVALLVVVALMAGCVSKATGGGWFISDDNSTNPSHKVTFGFNVNFNEKTGKLIGQMQLKDHNTGQKVHIEEMNAIAPPDEEPIEGAFFDGLDKDGNQVYVLVMDAGEPGASAGDYIAIWILPPTLANDDSLVICIPTDKLPCTQPTWSGTIQGGNIQTH